MHHLQLAFKGEPPVEVIQSLPGLINCQYSGKLANVIITGERDAVRSQLAALGPDMIKEMDFDLESMFVELMKVEGYGFER